MTIAEKRLCGVCGAAALRADRQQLFATCACCKSEHYFGCGQTAVYGEVDRALLWYEISSLVRRRGPLGKILDVGCGSGELVHLLRRAGSDARGIDVDGSKVVEAAGNYGPFFRCGDIDGETDLYDLVLYVDVIEHIWDICGELDKALGRLRQGGRIFIYVPSVSNAYYRILKVIAALGMDEGMAPYWALASAYPHRVIPSDIGIEAMIKRLGTCAAVNRHSPYSFIRSQGRRGPRERLLWSINKLLTNRSRPWRVIEICKRERGQAMATTGCS